MKQIKKVLCCTLLLCMVLPMLPVTAFAQWLFTTNVDAFEYGYNSSVDEIYFTENVSVIGERAFEYCKNLKKITFEGDAPSIGFWAFRGVTATVYYPINNSTWTASVRQNYGGTLNWKPYCRSHVYITQVVTKPTCTEDGKELKICVNCSYSYYATIKAPGHTFSGNTCTVCGYTKFEDVPSNAYYFDAVQWAVENKITAGTSATTFSPEAPCTRAQAVSFLWRAAGCPIPTNIHTPFTDVVGGSYYETAVLWAVENKITSGTSATTFSPDATCTRGQIVSFLYRAFGEPGSANSTYTDVPADAYYADAVSWAVANGVTAGTGDGKFSPDTTCTRGQIVTFLYRCRDKI